LQSQRLRTAVCPGSFDPVTNGHVDIIERACKLFDRLFVAVLSNPRKQPLFNVDERLDMLRHATAHLDNVYCEHFDGLVVEYARRRQAVAIVRGLRAVSDFEYEFKMAAMNHHLARELETVYMMTSNRYSFLSSSVVKEVAQHGGDVREWVPGVVNEHLENLYGTAYRRV